MKDIVQFTCLALAVLVSAFLLVFGWGFSSALWRRHTLGKAVFGQPVANLLVLSTSGACVWLSGCCLLAFVVALGAGVAGSSELSVWCMRVGATAGADLILICLTGGSLAFSVNTGHLGLRRMRLAKACRAMGRSYGTAVVVWSAAGAMVGAAFAVTAQDAVRRLLAQTDASLFPSLHLPDAARALATSILSVGFWPVVWSGAYLAWYGLRLPPLEPDAG